MRALSPHIGAWVELPGGERIGRAARARPPTDRSSPAGSPDEDGRLLFGCADGALELLEVKPPGGRAMDAGAWLRGHAGSLA